MSAREAILARIHSRLAKSEEGRQQAVAMRLAAHAHGLVPGRGAGDIEHRIGLFTSMMEAVGGSVEVLDHLEDVPEHVAAYLRNANLPARIRRGGDSVLATLPWHRGGAITVDEGRAVDSDKASLTRAFAGVAETATIIQLSGADNPTSLNFLPEAHIVVLEAARLHGTYEEAWDRLRAALGEGNMPRTVNMISGPSRTGDIEQTIVRPAHRPKHMHVMIVR